MGAFTSPLLLLFGNFDAVERWQEKSLVALNDMDFTRSEDCKAESLEAFYSLMVSCNLAMLNRRASARLFLEAFGLTPDQKGFERSHQFLELLQAKISMMNFPGWWGLSVRSLLVLSDTAGTLDRDATDKWFPSPREICDIERTYQAIRLYGFGFFDLTSCCSRAFLQLGREDDAYELSTIAVSPQQKTFKKTTLVSCYSVLGQVAAKRGDLDEAEGHFANALKEAKLSRFPMLELIAARDWRKHLLEPKGRDCGAADAAIDGACAAMKKTREQLGVVLLSLD